MAYIYKITNNINQKSYIGKTLGTVRGRFIEHIRDSKKERCEQRPLYSAMNKYGVENFSIEELEQCSSDDASVRETYWIEYYGTFKNGYNATTGGDGKPYIDYDLVVKTYKEVQSQAETARIIGINKDSVSKILKERNVNSLSCTEVNKLKSSKPVGQYDLDGNLLNTFSSLGDAERKTGFPKRKISPVCNGARKTAYGFIWRFI